MSVPCSALPSSASTRKATVDANGDMSIMVAGPRRSLRAAVLRRMPADRGGDAMPQDSNTSSCIAPPCRDVSGDENSAVKPGVAAAAGAAPPAAKKRCGVQLSRPASPGDAAENVVLAATRRVEAEVAIPPWRLVLWAAAGLNMLKLSTDDPPAARGGAPPP